jgi:excisionase family DNA binding protein
MASKRGPKLPSGPELPRSGAPAIGEAGHPSTMVCGPELTPTPAIAGGEGGRPRKLLLSPAETCELLSIGRTTCHKWMAEGLLRSVKIGGKRLIQYESVREISRRCDGDVKPH